MANQPPQRSISAPVGGVNGHKISLNNSHVLKGSVTNSNNRKSGQTKKIVIKNLKVRTDISEDYSQEAWRKLEESIAAIHTSCAISYSLEELYLAVENSCSHGMAPVLYENLKCQCQKYTASQLPEFNQDNVDEGTYLLVVNRIWESFCHQMILIRGIFLYLDRTYAVPHQTLPAIWEMGLELFGLVINQPKICDRILKGILAYIYKERCGESVDRTLLKNLLRMFVDLQLYQSLFELEFLRETEKLYYAESLKMLRDNEFTLPDYLNHIDKRLSQEQDRLLHYLHKTTKKPLILCVEKQLVGEHLQEILNKGFESLLEANRYPQLSLLHQLFSRFKDGITLVRKAFGEYIKKLGVTIVNDMERDKQMVQDLLELKDKVEKIISESFKNESKFHDIVRESFENVINRRQNKPAELVAKYVDVQLRSGNKEWSDEELERLLDRVLVLFRYIHGKDVFEAFYKKDLAKRLLLAKSASFDAEKTMLLKLKQECGPSFTSKLEGMFKDIELSKEMFVNFKQHIQSSSRVAGSIDLSVNVLTMGYWPTYPPMEILLPSEMSCHLDVFKDFYIKKHSGRKLQWQHSLGSCVLRTSFTQVEKELQVSLFQSLVLLLFNQADSLTYTDISQSTGIGWLCVVYYC
jgi:cullin-4